MFIKNVVRCFKTYVKRTINVSIFNFQNLIPVCISEVQFKFFIINCYEIPIELSFFLYLRAVFVFEKCKLSILIKYGSGDVTWISSSSMISSSKNMLSTNVLDLEVTREGKFESNSRSNFRLYKMNKKRSSKRTNNIVEMKCI